MPPLVTFPPDVVTAVCRHLADDHADDVLLIARALGGLPDAVAAVATGVDSDALHVSARTGAGTREVRIPFAAPATERPQLRTAVVELHERALAATTGAGPR